MCVCECVARSAASQPCACSVAEGADGVRPGCVARHGVAHALVAVQTSATAFSLSLSHPFSLSLIVLAHFYTLPSHSSCISPLLGKPM